MTTPRPKPPRLPEWATTTLEILEPSSGEKGTGWPRAFRVPADWWNWLNNLQYKWFRRTAVIATSNLMGRSVAPAGERMTMIKCFPYPAFSQGVPLESEPDSAERYHAWVYGIEGGANGYKISQHGIKAAPVDNVPPASSNPQPYDMIHDGTDFVMTARDMTPDRITIYWGPDIDDLSNRFDISAAVVFQATRPTALAYDGATYVVAGDEDEIVWAAAQGGPWTAVQLVAGLEIRDMKYSSALGKFCVVGNGGAGDAIFTSVDGKVYVQQVAPAPGEPATGWGTIAVMPNGEFCVSGASFTGGGVIMHSTTGGTVWVRSEPFPTGPDVGYNLLLAGDRLIVLTTGLPGAAPSGADNTTVYESYDNALTWQLVGMAALFNGDYQTAIGFVAPVANVPGGASFGFDGEQWFARATITESATGIFGADGYLSEMFMAREK